MKWGGAPTVAMLLYAWPLVGAFHVGGVRLAPREADLLLFAILAPLAVATVAAWILDEIIIPAGTPRDPVILRERGRRAARVVWTLCLLLMAAGSAQYTWQAWKMAHTPAPGFATFFMTYVYWSGGASLVALGLAAGSAYVFRPRHRAPGLCPNCSYSRVGLAPDAKCPECGTAAPVV